MSGRINQNANGKGKVEYRRLPARCWLSMDNEEEEKTRRNENGTEKTGERRAHQFKRGLLDK